MVRNFYNKVELTINYVFLYQTIYSLEIRNLNLSKLCLLYAFAGCVSYGTRQRHE